MTDHARPAFGPCCACGASGPTVRNILMLSNRGPVPGEGWGCLECGLPPDGACAVVCDGCLHTNAPLREACAGYVSRGDRVPRAGLSEPFLHDPARHPGEAV